MEKKVTGFDYLWLALYAFAGVGLELVLVWVEGMTGKSPVLHLLITTLLWVIAGFVVIFVAKKTTDFDIWEYRHKLEKWQYAALFVCIAISIAAKSVVWNGFKPLLEFQSLGAFLFIFQYIYYIAEGFLISLILVFGQKACEKWFHNEKIPYGGIVLGLTWGLMHIVSKGDIGIGILTALSGFLYGVIYLIVNRDYRKALPVITLMFIV